MVIAFGGQDQEQIVQPAKVEAFAVSWGNAAGGQFSGRGVLAEFPIASLPEDECEIRVVTSGKEYRIGVDRKLRARMR